MSETVLLSIQVGLPQNLGVENATDPMDKPWTTGFFKEKVAGRIRLGKTNLDGDGQADLQHHGGLEKAVNVYPSEHYSYWREELKKREMLFGAFGENFTTAGLLEQTACIGDVFSIGEAVVQISQPRQPCWKLARRWRIKDLAAKVQKTGLTGWYFRVLQEGCVEENLIFRLLERPHPVWTVSLANTIMHRRKHDIEAARLLASCPALSQNWRESLSKRATAGKTTDTSQRLVGDNESD